jgi:hypothetical protein
MSDHLPPRFARRRTLRNVRIGLASCTLEKFERVPFFRVGVHLLLLDALTGEPNVRHCAHARMFLLMFLDFAPRAAADVWRQRARIHRGRLAARRQAARQQRPATALGVTRQMPLSQQLCITPDPDQRDIPSGTASPLANRCTGTAQVLIVYPRHHSCVTSCIRAPPNRAVATSRPPPAFLLSSLLFFRVQFCTSIRRGRASSRRGIVSIQHAVLQVCIDLRCVKVRAHRERAREWGSRISACCSRSRYRDCHRAPSRRVRPSCRLAGPPTA